MRISSKWLCVVLALWVAPAAAQGLDAGRARALIDDLLYVYAPREGVPFALATMGEPSVDAGGGGFDVALPGLTAIIYGLGIELGDVTLHLEDAADNGIRMTAALPERADIRAPDGGPTAELRLGSPRFAGIWDHALFAFRELDAGAADISIAASDGMATITVKELTITAATEPSAPERWHVKSAVRLQDVSLLENESGINIDLAGLTYRATLSEVDLASYGAFVQATRFDPLSMWPRTDLPEELMALAADVYDIVAIAGQATAFEARGLEFRDGRNFALSLSVLDMTSNWTNLAGGRVTVDSRTRMDGLALTADEMADMAEFIPHGADLRFVASNVPVAQVLRVIAAFASESGARPEEWSLEAEQAFVVEMRRLFGESGVEFRIIDSRIVASAASAHIDATTMIDATSAFGVVGSLTLEMAGFERVIEMAREQSRDAAEIAAVLLIVQGLGEQVTRPDGAIARRYELTVDGAGAVRLNGNDLGPLLRSLQGRPR